MDEEKLIKFRWQEGICTSSTRGHGTPCGFQEQQPRKCKGVLTESVPLPWWYNQPCCPVQCLVYRRCWKKPWHEHHSLLFTKREGTFLLKLHNREAPGPPSSLHSSQELLISLFFFFLLFFFPTSKASHQNQRYPHSKGIRGSCSLEPHGPEKSFQMRHPAVRWKRPAEMDSDLAEKIALAIS